MSRSAVLDPRSRLKRLCGCNSFEIDSTRSPSIWLQMQVYLALDASSATAAGGKRSSLMFLILITHWSVILDYVDSIVQDLLTGVRASAGFGRL